MRKHFLLLFLMALLPLAGWAVDPNYYDVQVTTYNGSAVWCGGKPAVQSGWFTAAIVGGGTPSAAVKNAIANKLQVKDLADYNAGPHDYQLELISATDNTVTDNDANVYTIYLNSSTTATLTITKYTGNIAWRSLPTYVGDDLEYTSEAQPLLANAGVATANGGAVDVIYAFSATPATEADIFTAYGDVKGTNAGDYQVYYKVVGDDNHNGTGWTPIKDGDEPLAKKIAKIDNAINDLALAGWTYDPVKTAAPVATGETPDITFTATYGAAADATFTYAKKTNNTWGDFGDYATVVGGHAGSYKVKATIAASTNYNAVEAEVEFTIAKATPELDVEGVINTAWNLYDGQGHDLFLKPATAKINNTVLENVIRYNYRYITPDVPSFPGGMWVSEQTDPKHQYYTRKNAGKYQVRITIGATDDYNAVDYKENNSFVTITVAQADITGFTAPEGKTGLRVKGANEAQDLVTEASWGDNDPLGTFKYKVNEADWSADAKGTTAGTYSVNFQIVPTDAVNYKTYTIAEPLSVTIAAKSTVTIAVKEGQTFGYGTTPVIEKTVTWSDDHSKVDFSTAEAKQLKWAWYDNAECSGDPVEPTSGYYPVGSYYVKGYNAELTGDDADYWQIAYTPALVKITAGQIVATIGGTATYGSEPTFTLTHVSGLPTAEAATLNDNSTVKTVTIKNKETGAIVTYKDGDENKELKDVVLNSEAEGYNAAAKAALAKLNAGPYTLEATADYTPGGVASDNYTILVNAGTLKVNPNAAYEFTIGDIAAVEYKAAKWEPAVTVTGLTAADYTVTYGDDTHDNINAGTGIVKIAGVGNYAGATGSKTFTINKAALTITANNRIGDDAWTYGKAEFDEFTGYTATVTGLKSDNDYVDGKLAGIADALTVVRTSNETVGMHEGALVAKFGTTQPAESDNYTITYKAGNLQIAQGTVVIKLAETVGAEDTYGDNPATSITAAIRDITKYECVSGLSNVEAANFASIIDVTDATYVLTETKPQVGTPYTFEIKNATSTNYKVEVQDGTYQVGKKSPIVLYAVNQTINWIDGLTTNDAPNKVVSDATVGVDTNDSKPDLQWDDEVTDLVASIVITTTKIGENPITLTAKENGNYKITLNPGVLTVIGEEETIQFDLDGTDLEKIQSYANPEKAYKVRIKLNRSNVMNEGKANEKVYTWNKYDWNTMVLPFEVTVRELSKAIGYAIVNVYDETNTKASDAGFKVTMGTIPANTPFLLKTDADIADDFYIEFEGKNIVAPTAPMILTAQNGISYIGTYESVVINNENSQGLDEFNPTYYKYYAEDKIKGVGKTSSNKYTAYPFSAFFNWTAPTNSAPEMTITVQDMDGTTTTIRSIETEGKNVTDGLYNLQGVKMQGAPTQKGIYIKDGKKVVIK